MMMGPLLLLFSILTLTTATATVSFNFDQDIQQWGIWGDGLGSHRQDVGHQSPGSLWLSTDFGETQTAHYHWGNLTPGNYRVVAYVRARRVQTSHEGVSFWHFYDGGVGTRNVFMDLHGNYEFRKVEYVLKVLGKDLSLWFRLKVPGQVWIDDLTLEKTSSGPTEVFLAPPRPLQLRTVKGPSIKRTAIRRSLAHPEKLSSREYYNFNVESVLHGDWRSFERVEMEVFNGTSKFYPFFLTLGDEGSVNYWSQLNHKTHLAPGINHLSFDLRQFLGERGSHRFHRPLNLERLRKMFVVIDPDGRLPVTNQITMKNVSLMALPPPQVPRGVLAIDFTSHKSQGSSDFTKVTTQDLFDPETGMGFINPSFWRVEDSVYLPENLRYTIGLKSGKFRVSLPDGKYRISLVMEKLGLWDPPFWRNRRVSFNRTPLLVESRSDVQEYLRDLLRFEKIVPGENDHPFDLYLSELLAPIEKTVEVKNRSFELEFDGDPSGIGLNTLVIWPLKEDKVARDFLKRQQERDKLEFDWISRPISSLESPAVDKVPSLVAPELDLTPQSNRRSIGDEIELTGFEGERPFALIQIPMAQEVSFSLSKLKGTEGKVYPAGDFGFNELVYQYISPDLNHETYMIAGKYFRPLQYGQSIHSRPMTRYYSLQVSITPDSPAGIYRGALEIQSGKQKKVFPVTLTVMPQRLPKLNFPVGFFGLDPIPHTYFEGPGLQILRQKYRHLALRRIAESGFTTYTGLPADTVELDELFRTALKYGLNQPVFSYGGKFPQELLEKGVAADELRWLLARPHWPTIVHTFSDEAGGYSNRIQEDLELGQNLKKIYPFLALGGFSSLKNNGARKLNRLFDYGFYSGLQEDKLIRGQKWGSYNASSGNLHDPRYAFGPGLFLARERGLGAYLEWHLVGVNNYPYYDLDGRESDVAMLLPSLSGELYSTLRFELATDGIQSLKKLFLLKELIERNEGTTSALTEAKRWLSALRSGNKYLQQDDFLRGEGQDFPRFHKELNQQLMNITGHHARNASASDHTSLLSP